MKKIVYILIVFSVFTIFSCNLLLNSRQETSKTYRYNGIYLTVEKGLVYPFFNDSSKTLIIDTVSLISLSDIEKVEKQKDKNSNWINLYIKLTEDAKSKFAVATQKHISETFAIILNDKLVSAPVVWAEIPNGEIIISGIDNYTIEEFLKTFRKFQKQNK